MSRTGRPPSTSRRARSSTPFRLITVATINGNQVVVSSGLAPGTVVVTQGGEELLGVQNGIGVET